MVSCLGTLIQFWDLEGKAHSMGHFVEEGVSLNLYETDQNNFWDQNKITK